MVFDGKKSFQLSAKFRLLIFFSKDKVVLVRITINNKITFEAHTENLCKKWVLKRIRRF